MTDVLVRDSDLRNLLYATADWVQLGPVAANARASLDAALTTRLMASTDCDPLPVALSPREAIAIVGPLLRSIAGEDWTDADTWRWHRLRPVRGVHRADQDPRAHRRARR
jgi:hypothetical protein